MNFPDGLQYIKGHEEYLPDRNCIKLNQSLYGLVQAAREWWRKLTGILRKIGFTGGNVDPCLMFYKSKKGQVFMAIYVDDCLCVGDDDAIDEVIKKIKQEGLKLKIEANLEDYLNCQIVFSEDKRRAWLGQPDITDRIVKKFGKMVEELKEYGTPGTPNMGIIRKFEEDVAVTDEEQALYRSGVGTLLYLVKHSRPDIANVTQELSKTTDKASKAGLKELKRVLKYVIDTKEYGLKIEPKIDELTNWKMVMYTDSDYAGDKDTRISVTGYILFLCGVPIAWKSKAQKSVSLSSSEAEYVALSEAVKEIRFVYYLLTSFGINVVLPIKVRVDNIGAMFMSENVTTSNRTKHVDTRYNYVREFVEDKFIEITFVRSEDNYADIFTKNVKKEVLDNHKGVMIGTESDIKDNDEDS